MFTIYDGRDCFYQWDKDRKLIVHDETIKEVHFCNKTDDCSLVCEVYAEGELNVVNVPNILLQDNWRINAYAYDENYTKHSEQFDVMSRTKPADYVYTETEIKNYSDLESRIEALESRKSASNALFYTSLLDAVTDMTYYTTERAIEDEAAAKVRVVKEENGRFSINLLDNVAETEKLYIYDDIDLYLNGYEITLTKAAFFALVGKAAIYNGTISKSGNQTKTTAIIQVQGSDFVCKGVTLNANETTANKTYAFYISASAKNALISDCAINVNRTSITEYGLASAVITFKDNTNTPKVVVENCTIEVTATTNCDTAAIYNSADITIKDCNIHTTIEDASGNYAVKGLNNYGAAKIVNSKIKGEANASNVFTIENWDSVVIDNSEIEARTVTKGNATAFTNPYAMTNATADFNNSTIKAAYLGDVAGVNAHGAINNDGTLTAKNTIFFGDAKGGNVEGVPFALGFANYGTTYLDNCDITGVHSGMQQNGNAYINGGTFIGTVHGGIYVGAIDDKETFVNDVTFYDARYEGEMPEVWKGRLHSANCWGAIYIGGGGKSGIFANFDGCTFNGCKHSIAMRGSLGEKNNTVNLSNCSFGNALNGKECTVNFHNNTHHINVGFGTNFTDDHIFTNNFDVVEGMVNYTNKLYRKHNKDYALKGADFEALTNYIMAQGV